MSNGLFDFIIKMCTVGSFLIFSFLGISFALISVFKIFSQFFNKIKWDYLNNIDCSKKPKEKSPKKKRRTIATN